MTAADDQSQKPDTTQPPSPPKKTKKPKSKGFIESTSFQPTWLETGPLSPDMLPPEVMDQVLAEAATGEEMSDDLVAKLAELERLYSEASDDGPDTPPVQMAGTLAPTAQPNEPSEVTSIEEASGDEERVNAAEHTDVAAVAEPVITPALEQAAAPPDNDTAPTDAEAESLTFDTDLEDRVATAVADAEAPVRNAPDGKPAAVTPVAATPPTKPAQPTKEQPQRRHPLFDGLGRTLLILGLILLGLAALTYFINPFARLALATAELARPAESPNLPNPAAIGSAWCVAGSFLGNSDLPLPMVDNGRQGDIVAGDQVYALEVTDLPAGTYAWRVVGCDSDDLAFPAANSWIQVTDGRPVTFLFDSQERAERLFFPIPFVVSALDGADRFQVVGNFQDFTADDPTAELQHLGGGVYQHVRRIARPGVYEGYITALGNSEQAIDAYGRTSEPIPFSFEVSRASDVVVFLLDTNRGRASVLYGMPRVATELAYGSGFRILSLILGLGGLLLLGWMLLRMVMMGNESNWLEAGCPNCGRHELMRISRKPSDRLLNFLGIPAYRYQCRNCTWVGTRLSEDGAPVSPGATTIVADPWR